MRFQWHVYFIRYSDFEYYRNWDNQWDKQDVSMDNKAQCRIHIPSHAPLESYRKGLSGGLCDMTYISVSGPHAQEKSDTSVQAKAVGQSRTRAS